MWKNGKPVRLTPREYALLEMLIRKRDLALTRGELLTTAWGYEYVGASRTVDVHINRLRTKLGLDKEIQTVFKVGYRLNHQSGLLSLVAAPDLRHTVLLGRGQGGIGGVVK